MRLFLIWGEEYNSTKKLIEELKSHSHEIVYWVGLKGENSKLPGAVFHDHYAAWGGNPAKGEDINEFAPAGKNLIEKMYKTESLVLTMMNKKYNTLCVDERKTIYYNMLRYWDGIIKKYKPDMIVFNTVPHTVYNFVLYNLAKLYNIKTIMFEDSWISDRLLTYNDWMEGSIKLQKEMEKNKGRNFSLSNLSEDIREYYEKQTDSKQDATPIYMQHFRKVFSRKNVILNKLKVLINSIKNGTVFSVSFRFITKQFKPNLKKEYLSVETEHKDGDDKFIYVPLSFQPERTSSPQGDMFSDQILMVETLTASLPDGWKVYVKEHPSQWWLRSGTQYSSARYKGYYKRMAQIKNVILLPIYTNSFNLIKKSCAVATVTGTAGWESLLRLKPTLIFGYPWYRDYPSVYRIDGVESCRKALKDVENGAKIDSQEIINFLYSFDKATIHGYIENFVDKVSKLNKEECLLNISKEILKDINNN